MTDALIYASATRLAQRIRDKEVSAEEVVEAHLQRIAAVNPHLNAIVQLTAETARAEARAADAALARGDRRGPLHGVPFTVKDIFDTEGVICAAGLEERAAFVPARDATVVARMRAAGAILLGKTNCPPGGSGGESWNPVYGVTCNPYDPARTCGGSSGGEAAIIAVGGSPVGIGSDSGGSIRLPAHYCGVAGLRPTAGRVPATGGYDLPGGLRDLRTQTGPLARYVEDLGLALAVIAGVDWRDSAVIPMPLGDPAAIEMRGLRVAFYTDDGIVAPTAETAAAVGAAAGALAQAGCRVEESRPPGIPDAWPITQGHWRRSEMCAEEIERLMAEWDGFRTTLLAFMEDHDVIICPVSDGPAVVQRTLQMVQFSYDQPYSLTGYPCVVVRAGTAPGGLPLGVQVVARPWREDVALAAAGRIETALGGWQPPPSFIHEGHEESRRDGIG